MAVYFFEKPGEGVWQGWRVGGRASGGTLLLPLPPVEGGQGESYGILAGGLAPGVRELGFLG